MLGMLGEGAVCLPQVADPRHADVDAARLCAILRVLPAFADAAKLELRQRKHDREDKLAGCGGRVELAVSGQRARSPIPI